MSNLKKKAYPTYESPNGIFVFSHPPFDPNRYVRESYYYYKDCKECDKGRVILNYGLNSFSMQCKNCSKMMIKYEVNKDFTCVKKRKSLVKKGVKKRRPLR